MNAVPPPRALDPGTDRAEGHGADAAGDRGERDRAPRRGRRRRGEPQQDNRQHGDADQRPSASSETNSKSRLAARSEVIWPGPSYGGDTSTRSQPTSGSPWRLLTSTSASQELSPPTSGLPVAGASAGS